MTSLRESTRSGSYWHVDCRIESELPEDHFVSPAFIANVFFASVTLVVLLFFAWLSYRTFGLMRQIHEWDRRIGNSMSEVHEIQRLQREYVTEASKIDQAYGVIRPTLFISEFISVLGRTLPSQINVEILEWNDTDIVMRGVLRESPKEAIRILGEYIELLRKNDKIGPRFRDIRATGFERARGREEMQSFGIIFRLQPMPPL